MNVAGVGKQVGAVFLPQITGNKRLGDASANLLAGIVRVTGERMGMETISSAPVFKSGNNFVEWFNKKFLNPKLFKKGMTQDGRFIESLREALNKTGCTVNDFAKWVKDMTSVGKLFEKDPALQESVGEIFRGKKIDGIDGLQNFLLSLKKVSDGTGLTIEEGIEHCVNADKVQKAIESALRI